MIQDNEAILIGKVNGHELRASDIVLYDDEDNIYQLSTDQPIVFPPDLVVTSFSAPVGADIVGLETPDDPDTPFRIYNLPDNQTDFFGVTVQFSGQLFVDDVIQLVATDRNGEILESTEFIYVGTLNDLHRFERDGDDVVVDSLGNNVFVFKDTLLDEVPGVENFVSYGVKIIRDGIEKTSNTTDFILGMNGVSINGYGATESDSDVAKLIFDFPYGATVDIVLAGDLDAEASIRTLPSPGTQLQRSSYASDEAYQSAVAADAANNLASRTLTFASVA
jgi:hypothetical protein